VPFHTLRHGSAGARPATGSAETDDLAHQIVGRGVSSRTVQLVGSRSALIICKLLLPSG
jgi:hypothetical protein